MRAVRVPACLPFLAAATLVTLSPSAACAEWSPGGEVVPIADCSRPIAWSPDGEGGLFRFWTAKHPASPLDVVDIRGVRRWPNGRLAFGWPDSGLVVASVRLGTTIFPEALAAAEDGAGGAFLAIRECRGVTSSAPVVHRLFHMLASGALDPAWPDSGLAIGRPEFPGSVSLAGDGAGGVYAGLLDVVRAELTAGTSTWRGLLELRLARVTGAGAVAPGWSAEGVLVRGAAPESLRFHPRVSFVLAADGAAGALLAWADSSGGVAATRLWRYGPNGGPAGGWPAAGVTFTATELTSAAALLTDGAGGAYVAWTDSVPGFGSARLSRLDGAGETAPGWPAGGLEPASAGQPYQWMGGIAPDGAGGVYAQIDEAGIGGPTLTRLVHRDAGGGVPAGWTAQGLALGDGLSGVSAVSRPVAVAGGGVHAVWGMGAKLALFDLRVAFDGTVLPGWSAASPRSSTVPGEWWGATVLGDGLGAVHAIGQSLGAPACDAREYQLGLREAPPTSVPPVRATGLALEIGPNPSSGEVAIELTLQAAADAEIDVLDAAGRRVRSWRARMGVGANRVRWDGYGDGGVTLVPGLYFVVARAAGGSVSRRVAVLR